MHFENSRKNLPGVPPHTECFRHLGHKKGRQINLI
nr:MAG TPA: hypothetical protein [Caudoviricetes sp.]